MKRRKTRCWKGYKPVKGKRPYSKGSCRRVRKNASVRVWGMSRKLKVLGYQDRYQYLTDGMDVYRRDKIDKKMNSMGWFSTLSGFPSFLKMMGPLMPTPPRRGLLRNSMNRIPTQKEYEMNELTAFRKQMQEVEELPLSERQDNAREWFKDLMDDQKLIAERVGWLLNGSYGKGSFDSACRVIASPRMNQVAWCAITIANLEWRCPAKMAIASWKKLPVETRYIVNEAIRREIADAKAEKICG